MHILQASKNTILGIKTSGNKEEPTQPHSPNLDALEKSDYSDISYTDEPEEPRKCFKAQKIAYHTFIQPCRKRPRSCKVVFICIGSLVMIALILFVVLFCGVFQETKDHAVNNATGEVIQKDTMYPTPTTIFY